MSATLSEPDAPPEHKPRADAGPSAADASQLVDRMPVWFRTPKQLTLHVLFLAVCFIFFSYRPLWHSDLWGHLAYGRLIAERTAIPQSEPFMPLAEGVPLVDTAWLSQLAGYAAYSLAGETALQFLSATGISLCLSLLAWRFYERTQDLVTGLAALAAFLWLEWHTLVVFRPQLAGLCCFVGLLVLLSSRRECRRDWFLVPALMALWANLHGSFALGILLPGTLFAGRVTDVIRRTGTVRAAWNDRRAWRLLLLTQLAAVAVLANPYGIQLYAEVLTFSSNPNLSVIGEWEPLTLRSQQGVAVFAIAVAIAVLLRFSPRRVTAGDVLLLIGLGAASLWTSRFLVWWAPVAAMTLALHGHAVVRGLRRRLVENSVKAAPPQRRSLWTVASLGMLWIGFAYTPFGMRVLHGEEPELSRVVSSQTPIRAAEYLRKHPPAGPLFNAMEFGDYLAWSGVRTVFVTSHVHLVPREVWRHYLAILTAESGWADLLARYGVNVVVLNPYDDNQASLLSQLRASPAWRVDFEDERSVVFGRVKPIPPPEWTRP